MSSTLERTAPAAERTRAEVSAHSRRGGWARRRVELRLAARQTRRAWPTSILVIALVALPMMLISCAVVFAASRNGTVDQRITAELGAAQSWFMVVGGADPSRSQSSGDPFSADVERDDDWVPVHPELPAPASALPSLPDVEVLQVDRAGVIVRTPGGTGTIDALIGDAADPRLDGRYELVDGRRPAAPDEAALSPGALARIDAAVGDTIRLVDPDAEVTVVGVMKEATARDADQSIFLSASAGAGVDADVLQSVWFTPDWQPTAADLPALNHAGVVAYAHDLVAASEAQAYQDPASAWAIAAGSAVVGAFTAYLVILLAGAGFAVSARRQQRSLAVAASVGADRGSVFRIVLLQGTVLGLVGGTIGTALGIALALPALILFDDGALHSFWGFHVPWWALVGIVLFATAVGTVSAALPARAATKGDVLASLRGARRPAQVRAHRPLWGTLLGAAGLIATVVGGLGLAGLNAVDRVDYSNPLRTVFLVAIIAGPVLFQVGVIVAGHWLLSVTARGASRLGLAPRIAARDAAANPSRIVPAFAAIAACVFIASFALTATAVYTAQAARNWWYQGPVGSIVIDVWSTQDDDAVAGLARTALEETDPDAIGAVRTDVDWYQGAADAFTQDAFYPELFDYVDCATIERGTCTSAADARLNGWSPAVVAPDDLATVLGRPVDAEVLRAFADGGAVVVEPTSTGRSGSHLDDGAVVINTFARDDLDAYWMQGGDDDLPAPTSSTRIPAEAVAGANPLPWPVILSPAAADDLGYQTMTAHLVGSFTAPPEQQALDRLAMEAGQPWNSDGGFSYRVENGPPVADAILWLILGAAGILVLGAGGVALGLARVERRPDDATLAAVGASTGIRRRIAFCQALVIVGIGSITGTAAGVIPLWGIVIQSQSDDQWALHLADTPWLWLALLALGLPLVIAAVSWLVPTRRPDLTRRTVIA